ncbi:MAG: hydrogen peroxide-inducible genes activator, partial [Burkholderiales bacterium]
RHMVASGIGITVLPWTACAQPRDDDLLRYIPFDAPPPHRRVSLVWRKSFTRAPAIEALRRAILDAELPGATKLSAERPASH